jgi:hypothetical protein
MRALPIVIALLAGCGGDLPEPYLIANLRILGVQATPPEGEIGTEVSLRSLVTHPDEAEGWDQVWLACVSQPELQATLCGGIPTDGSAPPAETPPLCSSDPEAAFCTIGFGGSVDYRLPAVARDGRPADENGQILVTVIAALESAGGLDGCLDAFSEAGRVPETCRIAVKRVNVLPDGAGAAANRNPELTGISFDGEEVIVTLSGDSIEETADGPEEPFFSWFVSDGELSKYRTDGEDGLSNVWKPTDAGGEIIVVVRDGRGGEDWISGMRP